jgi:hypothetical protein
LGSSKAGLSRCLRYRSRSVGVVEPHCPGIPISSQAGACGPLIIVGHPIDAVGEAVAGAARIGKGEPAFSSHVVLSQPRTPGPSRGFNVTPKFRGGGYTCRHIEQPFPDHHKPSRPASRICSWAIRCGSGQCRQKASRSCLLAWRMVRARAQRSPERVYLN